MRSCVIHYLTSGFLRLFSSFFFNDTATTEIYTFPYTTLFRSIDLGERLLYGIPASGHRGFKFGDDTRGAPFDPTTGDRDRKSTRLNSSHLGISYAVFCLKKKKKTTYTQTTN